jgi:lysyl-tRNA synthetase class 2
MDRGTWHPACSLDVLQIRAGMLRAIREFFWARGYLEVETPCLSQDVVLDAWIEPFRVPGAGREPDRFLQTSPEAFMKRLLAAGSQSIYQVARVFRQGEFGERHNPEFTMVEWYGVGDGWREQLAFTESLVRFCLKQVRGLNGSCVPSWPDTSFPLLTYAAAFEDSFGLSVHEASDLQLLQAVERAHLAVPESGREYSRNELLNLMLGLVIEPKLGGLRGAEAPVFLCDYPPDQAALAVIADSPTPVARRFELYVRGLELCNGYQELTDAAELLRREQQQQGIRETFSSSESLPGAPRLRDAMAAGLPPCSGVALGFDRLVMLAIGAESIHQVLPFPADRA